MLRFWKRMLADDVTVVGQIAHLIPVQERIDKMNYLVSERLDYIFALALEEGVHPIEMYFCARAQGLLSNEDIVIC